MSYQVSTMELFYSTTCSEGTPVILPKRALIKSISDLSEVVWISLRKSNCSLATGYCPSWIWQAMTPVSAVTEVSSSFVAVWREKSKTFKTRNGIFNNGKYAECSSWTTPASYCHCQSVTEIFLLSSLFPLRKITESAVLWHWLVRNNWLESSAAFCMFYI